MYPAKFDYLAPQSLGEALALLAERGDDAKILAGGHSLLPAMKLRLSEPACLIDIGHLPDLRGVSSAGGAIVIGALTLHAEVATARLILESLPGLAQAAASIGDVQVRNRGTIGGSVAHADPSADLPVILMALNASFALASADGVRLVPADDFFIDYFTTALAPNEVLTEIRLPLPPPGSGSAYAKLPHPASGYLVVSAGVLIVRDASNVCSRASVVVGGLTGSPLRATEVEAALSGRELTPEVILSAAAAADAGGDPEGDAYATAEYKRQMARVYARKAIETAAREKRA